MIRHPTLDLTFLNRFLEANPGISTALSIEMPPVGSRLHHFATVRRHVGWYRLGLDRGVITVFPDLCTKPGHGYSWPGHISDRTVQGVLAHELGHHAHHSRYDADGIRAEFPRRHRVTGYEPNVDESFAETFRLLVLNPDLLRQGRPERYDYMTCTLGFVPSETRSWQVVLENAPPRMLARIPEWMRRGGGAQISLL